MQPNTPSPSISTFHEFQRIDVILVPFEDLPIFHRRWFDGHQLVKPVQRKDKAARMLREMPRRAYQLARQIECHTQPTVSAVKVSLLELGIRDTFIAPTEASVAEAAVTFFGAPGALPTSRTAPRAIAGPRVGEAERVKP
jgi:hypothetical protein